MAAITFTSLTGTLTNTRVSRGRNRKRGLAGAAGGIFGGPAYRGSGGDSENTTHASGAAAGGVEDTSGYRKLDAYALDGATGGMAGAKAESQLLTKSNSRPTGRTAYLGEGVGGSDVTGAVVSYPGKPYQDPSVTGTALAYVYNDGVTGPITGTTGALTDKRPIDRGSIPGGGLGMSFGSGFFEDTTGSPATGATTGAGNTNKSGRLVSRARPTISGAAAPDAGSVSIVAGTVTGAIAIDLNADDITGGANGRKGAEILVVNRATDTDEDGETVITHASADGGTDETALVAESGATAATYAAYARWRYAGNAGQVEVGPWSARFALSVN